MDEVPPQLDEEWTRLGLLASGWFAYLPSFAFDVYAAIFQLGSCSERATEHSIRCVLQGPDFPPVSYPVGDFDDPLGTVVAGDGPEEMAWDAWRWEVFRADADRHGLGLATPHDVMGFMCELGLIQRDGRDAWSTIVPAPLLETVVQVSERDRLALESTRLHLRFMDEKRLLREWLVSELSAGADGAVATSLAAVAESLELPSEVVRTALMLLIDDGVVAPTRTPPESLADGDPVQIAVVARSHLDPRLGWDSGIDDAEATLAVSDFDCPNAQPATRTDRRPERRPRR
jgi:Family of unknown function (DUF6042)